MRLANTDLFPIRFDPKCKRKMNEGEEELASATFTSRSDTFIIKVIDRQIKVVRHITQWWKAACHWVDGAQYKRSVPYSAFVCAVNLLFALFNYLVSAELAVPSSTCHAPGKSNFFVHRQLLDFSLWTMYFPLACIRIWKSSNWGQEMLKPTFSKYLLILVTHLKKYSSDFEQGLCTQSFHWLPWVQHLWWGSKCL